ncbi:MAG: hypothetical protein Q4D51_07260 [Eubacteriales bacterium]|nr:hypothetical protein [Eubacteriales bacterium]
MTITNIFDAAIEGSFEQFQEFYDGDIGAVNKYTGLNLLQTVVCGCENYDERIEMIRFLLSEGIDVNYLDKKDRMNVLHLLYNNYHIKDAKYFYVVTKMLVEKGVEINQKDKRGGTPISHLIGAKIDTEELLPLFQFLTQNGADINVKDNYGNTCLDYAKQFSWRQGFVEMVEASQSQQQTYVGN